MWMETAQSTVSGSWRKQLRPFSPPRPVSSSDVSKAKSQPTFTIIIRRQLTVDFAKSCLQDQLPTKSVPDLKIDAGEDILLLNSWQIWLLATECQGQAWDVTPFGPETRSARAFWNNYSQVYKIVQTNSKQEEKNENIMIFQDEIAPKWESVENVGGGRWYFDVSYEPQEDKENNLKSVLYHQNYWTRSVETLLSASIDSSLIVGLVLTIKSSKYRVSFWTGACPEFNQLLQLGSSIRKALGLKNQLKFELHAAATNENKAQ